ncbi:MAG: phosphatase PAP2 family protein, partial [Alphaproteobacteria bacterium]|nr:phosphatase PAP2 family protein [Alphaproteobacteria bacterium]
ACSWLLHRVIIVQGLPAPRLSRRGLIEAALVVLVCVLSYFFLDRPAAYFFHAQSETVQHVFQTITLFGLSKWYLIGSALLWLALRLLPRLPSLAPMARRLEAWSYLPLYFFVSLAASGLAVDLIKVLVGRARPKLLFADSTYGFTGLASRADHWSFPSGHTANAVAIALSLITIWPRLLPLAVIFAGLVAASRFIIQAHYVSDVIAGGFLAFVITRYVEQVFVRSGVPIAAAKSGSLPAGTKVPWRTRFGFGAPAAQR